MNSQKNISWVPSVNKYQVKKSRSFDNDIIKIRTNLVRKDYSSSTIKDIFEEIFRLMALLRTNPELGTMFSNKTSIPNEYRYLIAGKYIVFYKVYHNEKLVKILHIYHSKENYIVKLGLID